ncbi:MAG: hypothetical protein AB7V40_05865 [Methyloceanibacter sp.]
MLTRALFALALILGGMAATAAEAGEPKVLALGLSDHELTQEELATAETPSVPRFNSAGIAYGWVQGLKKGDAVEIALVKDGKPLMGNSETIDYDAERYLFQAGKLGVPAGGWPDGKYQAVLKVARDGKTLIDQSSAPTPFE